MDSPRDAPSRGFWKGLARILHLPTHTSDNPPIVRVPIPSPKPVEAPAPRPVMLAKPPAPVSPPAKLKAPAPAPAKASVKSPAQVPVIVWKEEPTTPNKLGELPIITDYDRIFELVKRRQSMKLDEIARVLALKEEQVAQELQTLEDNGLVEVKYPAFGEPLIVYKRPDE